ncbi:hypothetical protein HYX01_01745 [Candidatus Woesearchaeota archaeon]|nr:hypothetical protein [Candidatus Woesearchaeota archaeon]
MDEKRKKLVLEFWDRSNVLNLENKEYLLFVKRVINEKLREDIGKGDITTNSLISKNAQAKAVVIAKQNGIVAGIDESSLLFENCRIAKNKTNGDIVKNKEIIFEVAGNARKILSCERTALNVMQRMSGIATLTSNLNKIIENRCFIIGTRKTAFGMMDKAAISCGKGLTHRINLNDGILIKDNHLKFLNNDFEKSFLQLCLTI